MFTVEMEIVCIPDVLFREAEFRAFRGRLFLFDYLI
jgi:hypothetical protein